MSIYGDLINESLSTMIQDKFDNKIKKQKNEIEFMVYENGGV